VSSIPRRNYWWKFKGSRGSALGARTAQHTADIWGALLGPMLGDALPSKSPQRKINLKQMFGVKLLL